MSNNINLRDEVGTLIDESDGTGRVFGKVEAAEAKVAAEALCERGRKLNRVAEASIEAFGSRLDDPRLPKAAEALGGLLVNSAETSAAAIRGLSEQIRHHTRLIERINPGGGLSMFPGGAVSAELDLIDQALEGLDPLINPGNR
jgi:hypothetical protein